MLTLETVGDFLSYDPATGVFTRKVSYGCGLRFKAGTTVGTKDKNGYLFMNIDGKNVKMHRLAYLFVTGSMPPEGAEVDHIDQQKDNNRWSNLRLASTQQNGQNKSKPNSTTARSSKYLGVYFNKRHGKFMARIKVNYKHIYLGTFNSEEDARDAYLTAKAKFHEYAPANDNNRKQPMRIHQ